VRVLGQAGIVTSERDNNLRVSAHAYNTADDVDHVVTALAANDVRHLLVSDT
jgi:selenocysteine lyase/cysteine desulfurase